MYPLFFFPPVFLAPDVVAATPEVTPPPLWLTLGLAGVATLVTALAWTLS